MRKCVTDVNVAAKILSSSPTLIKTQIFLCWFLTSKTFLFQLYESMALLQRLMTVLKSPPLHFMLMDVCFWLSDPNLEAICTNQKLKNDLSSDENFYTSKR
jgi:hypothetical protein